MIHREDHDGVAVLRLDHGKVNAIDAELFGELDERLDEVESAPEIRALVLTGTGGTFSAGVNLFKVRDHGPEYVEAFVPRVVGTFERLFTLPLPVVAAVNGHAIAGGLILALACDRRLLAEGDARLGLAELVVGVPFPTVALEIVRSQVPGRTAEDLILSARTFPGGEALALRLVDEIVPAGELLARSVETAARYGRIARGAFALSKRQLRAPAVALIERYRDEFDAEVIAGWKSAETRERISRYLDQTVGKK